ncbi:MAG: glucokinase [Campylobacterales bacterium]|nr:glucokinase [Campylobacterales bacterium]
MILAGDIGGTKTNFALYTEESGVPLLHQEYSFSSGNYTSFRELLNEFVQKSGVEKVDALCLGIAGPIVDGVCKTTNLPWTIETTMLQEFFKTTKVKLLNDLEATAYGMLYLKEDEFITLNEGLTRDANRAVIAAGTGLGEASLFFDGSTFYPIGSEGGHTDFAPQNALEDELLVWLRQRYSEHVSVERVVSGMGIATLYEFLLQREQYEEHEDMRSLKEGEDKSAKISSLALTNSDRLSLETMQLFVSLYGAEAGNLALKTLCLGGLYIGGGIAPKILPLMQSGDFMRAFVSKGRFTDMLRKIPVFISKNPQTALLGATHFAIDKLCEKKL